MEKPLAVRCGLAAALLLAACGGPKAQPPVPNQTPAPPSLGGMAVMVLPVQTAALQPLDAELGYWLGERAPQVKWVLPAAIDRTLGRNPALGVNPRSLEVAVFRRAQVKRIGDPLFGDLRRLAGILDARYALVPVFGEVAPGRIDLALALIDTHFGDVLWFGVLSDTDSTALAQRVANLFAPPKRT